MRARVYEDERGFMVKWQANRRYQTRAEAEEAAQLPMPPPPGKANVPSVSPELRELLRQILDGGMKPGEVAQILNAVGSTTARGSEWTGDAVRAAANYEPRPRDPPALMLVLQLEQPPELWSTTDEQDMARLRHWLRSEPRRSRLLDDALELLG
jgi:hypothetical protein